MKTGLQRTLKGFCGQMRQINQIGSDGKTYVWKERGEPLSDRTKSPTIKHGGGGNLMVWGCMGWNGVGKLIEVQGNMDKVQYCEILEDGVQESFEKLEMVNDKCIYKCPHNGPTHKCNASINILIMGPPINVVHR